MTALARQGRRIAEPVQRSVDASRRLSVAARGDPFEREADRVAEAFVSGSAGRPAVNRIGAGHSASDTRPPRSVEQVLSRSGRPLDAPVMTQMEQLFARDFSAVRVHADDAAERSAGELRADAYAVGNDVVFARGRFSPSTRVGRQLIAHELAHVVQANGRASTVFCKQGEASQTTSLDPSWDRAFGLADDARWEEAAELVNGFSPENLSYFIQTFNRQPAKIAQLYLGAIGNKRVGAGSQVALATKVTYLDVNFADEIRKANWSRAAFYINGFGPDDLRTRLRKLETEKLKALHEGAATNVELGVDSAAAKVSAELLASRLAQGEKKALLLPTVRGEGKEALLKVTRVIDGIKPSPNIGGMFTMTVDGQPQQLTEAQVDEVRKKTAASLRNQLKSIERKASSTADRYNSQNDVDRQHWLVAPIVKTLGRVKDPGPELLGYAFHASQSVKWALEAIDAGNLSHAAEMMAAAETAAISASKMWQAYFEGIIGAAEMTVTVLEITRDAAFITLAILATIATGGAAAGALGAVEGTAATATVLGLEVTTTTAATANLIAIAAPIVANVGEATAKVAMGDKVDWGALVVDTAVQIVVARFGGRVTGGIAKAMLRNPLMERLAGRVTEKIVHAAIMHVGSVALTTAAQDAYHALRGKPVTWASFIDDLITRLTDPKGLAVIAVAGAIGSAAESKYATPGPAATEPASTPSAASKPVQQAPTVKPTAGSGPSAARAASAPTTGAQPQAKTPPASPAVAKVAAAEPASPASTSSPAAAQAAAGKPTRGGATASGIGDDFTITRHVEPAPPEVTVRPSRGGQSPSSPRVATDEAPARSATTAPRSARPGADPRNVTAEVEADIAEAQQKMYPEPDARGVHTQSAANDDRTLLGQGRPHPKQVLKATIKSSADMGVEGGMAKAQAEGIAVDKDWNTPQQHKGEYGRGFDAKGSRGTGAGAAQRKIILEFKGGGSRLGRSSDGSRQMSNEHVGKRIAELKFLGDPAADELLAALDEGRLQGVVYQTKESGGEVSTSRKRGEALRKDLVNENVSDSGLITYARTKVRASFDRELKALQDAAGAGNLKRLRNP